MAKIIKKIVPVLILLFLVIFCVMAGIAAADSPGGKHKPGRGWRGAEYESATIEEDEDFTSRGVEGKQLGKRARMEALTLLGIEVP